MNSIEDLFLDIYSFILEQGKASFSDLIEFFEITEKQLLSIETSLKKQSPSVRKDGKNYIVKDYEVFPKSNESDPNIPELKILNYDWEKQGADRLEEIFQKPDFKKYFLKGEEIYAFCQLIEKLTSKPRTYTTKRELAEMLILKYGRDLFGEKNIREIVGKKCGLGKKSIPARWMSGQSSSREFVEKVGFPKEFQGIKSDSNKLPNHEFLPQQNFHKLVDFQDEIKTYFLNKLKNNEGKSIISLPTGAGKTKTAVSSILEYINDISDQNKKNVLWLAHTDELCEQAYACFKESALHLARNYDLYLFRYWGTHASEEDLRDVHFADDYPFVLISTPQKIKNILESRNQREVKEIFIDDLFLLVIDEAHRAGAPTYKHIINTLSQSKTSGLNILGLTATPFRKEYDKNNPQGGTEDLLQIFKDLILPENTLGRNLKGIKKILQKRQYLSQIKRIPIDTKIKIKIKESEKYLNSNEETSIIDRRIQARTDVHKRRLIILEKIKEELKSYPNGKFLYFGSTVRDVRLMTMLLRTNGYTADYVIGDRKISTRRKIISDFKNNKIQFLCNCEVLTTGFDEPKITHLIMARPTVSQVLYEQMIGRGLRGVKFGGTEVCRILSCEDMNLDYEKFYRIWRKDTDEEEVWDFETFFLRTLIFTLLVDTRVLDVELDKCKEIMLEEFGKKYTEQFIEEEMDFVQSNASLYLERLPNRIADFNLNSEQKIALFRRCIEISACDDHIDARETKFLSRLQNYLFSDEDK